MKQVLALLAGVFFSVSTFAHHSFAQFDTGKTVTVSGTVKEFQWTNPHCWIEVMVVNAKGQAEQWSIETEAPGVLKNRGWKSNLLNEGDKVTVDLHPKRDGSTGGSLLRMTMADGRVLGVPEPPAAAAAKAAAEAADKK